MEYVTKTRWQNLIPVLDWLVPVLSDLHQWGLPFESLMTFTSPCVISQSRHKCLLGSNLSIHLPWMRFYPLGWNTTYHCWSCLCHLAYEYKEMTRKSPCSKYNLIIFGYGSPASENQSFLPPRHCDRLMNLNVPWNKYTLKFEASSFGNLIRLKLWSHNGIIVWSLKTFSYPK